MQCPGCNATMPEQDAFCEECGAALSGQPPIPDCPKCGAGPGDIEADGFCSQCGFRRTPHERDHLEIVLPPSVAAVSDRGRRHSSNEDYVALRPGVIVVCDGVSSSQDAMLASQAAADAAADALAAGRTMQQAIAGAQAAVLKLPFKQNQTQAAPSTTIVAARLAGKTAEIGWVGDSRAYWISPNQSRQLTVDDSWINEVVSHGIMTTEQAQNSQNAHAVTKWLGADATDLEPSVMHFDFPGLGTLLLCTDGLWNYASEISEMEELVGIPSEALPCARKLVNYANDRGGSDNVTAVLFIEHAKG